MRLDLWLFALVVIPRGAVAAYKAGDTFWIDVLSVDSKGCLFALGGTLLLLAKHEVNLFGLDILSDMPCCETIFVLFFSNELTDVRRYCNQGSRVGGKIYKDGKDEATRQRDSKYTTSVEIYQGREIEEKDSSTMHKNYNLVP